MAPNGMPHTMSMKSLGVFHTSEIFISCIPVLSAILTGLWTSTVGVLCWVDPALTWGVQSLSLTSELFASKPLLS